MAEHEGDVARFASDIATEQPIAGQLSGQKDAIVVYPHPADPRTLYRALLEKLQGFIVLAAPSPGAKSESLFTEEQAARLLRTEGEEAPLKSALHDERPVLWVYEAGETWAAGGTTARILALRSRYPAPALVLSKRGDPDVLKRIAARTRLREPRVFYYRLFGDNLTLEVARPGSAERQTELAIRVGTGLSGRGIFFTESARTGRELAAELRRNGAETRTHFPTMRVREKSEALSDFVEGRTKLLVASSPLTLPRSLPELNFIVHVDMPQDLERYYLDVAGIARDEKKVRAILLYRRDDKLLRRLRQEKLPEATVGDISDAIRLLRAYPGVNESGMPVARLAQAAGESLARTRLILEMLEEAGAVEALGKAVFRPTGTFDEERLARVVVRHRAARERRRRRAQEMLHYAESNLCRIKVVRRYFALAADEACGRCDNCRRGTERRVRYEAKHAGTPGRAGAQRSWTRGDLAVHDAWGEGEVKQVWNGKLRIHFPGQGEKILKAEFVKRG